MRPTRANTPSRSRPERAPGNLEELSWSDYRDALQALVHASCCGAGSGGGFAATPIPDTPRFAKLGYTAWRESVKPAAPILPVESGPLVLPGMTIAEPQQAIRSNVDVFIANGRIECIAPAGAVAAGGAVVVEELRGQFVCPALADLHIHNPPSNVFNLTPLFLLLHLRHGIVRVREAGDTDGTATPAALALIESGALPGIDMHYCYLFVQTGQARWPNSAHFDHPEQAETIVRSLKRLGARWIKSYENLDVARVRALVEAAQRAGLGVMGHVPVKLAFEQAMLPDNQHFFGVPSPQDLRGPYIINRVVDWQGVTPARIAETVEICRRNTLAMTPTLSSGINLLRLEQYEAEKQAVDVKKLPGFYGDVIWHPVHGLPIFRNMGAADFRNGREAVKRKLELTHALWRGGVSLRLGTDVQQPFAVPGVSLHREMSAFEEAGVPRDEVWKLASLDAARVLGVDNSGKVEPGMRADVLTTCTSPFGAAWTPQQISAVVAGGHLIRARDLDASIDKELGRFNGAVSRWTSRWLAQFAIARLARRYIP
jgi:cytosine/adenosine deaminase-related metal-dependent hydrolase